MKVDIIISADDIKNQKIEGKSVVVIDVLRATSVMITAVNNGCTKVIPTLTVEEALKLSNENRSSVVLGGERRALKIDGFDFSNSPLEYTSENVKGKTVIMTTTNGTKAINGCNGAKNILLGAFINGSAVAERLAQLDNDVVIVNAGTYGQFSIDDFICSGYIIDKLIKRCDAELSDIAKTAHYVYEQNEDVVSFIKYARHYNVIKELGLEKDLEYCTTKDIINIVPEYVDGCIGL